MVGVAPVSENEGTVGGAVDAGADDDDDPNLKLWSMFSNDLDSRDLNSPSKRHLVRCPALLV